VSVLVIAQSSSEVPEGLMNNPVYEYVYTYHLLLKFRYFAFYHSVLCLSYDGHS